jgi:hypothetical protein
MRRRVSLNRPLTAAQFVSREVKEHHPPEGAPRHLQIFCQWGTYWGEYKEDYAIPKEAEQLFRSMKNGPLYVRYHPHRIDDCVLDPVRDIRPGPTSLK